MKKLNLKRTTLVTMACILAVLLVVLGGVAMYVNYLFGQFSRPSDPAVQSPGFSSGIIPSGSIEDLLPTGGSEGSRVDVIEMDTINIMLLGEDDPDGGIRGRTDAMVLCTVNTKTKVITMTSFMRDLVVTVPGYGTQRINAAYFHGNFDLLKETVLYNFGVEVDDFVKVNFQTFAMVVDLLGGVEVELTQEEADYLNKNYDAGLSAGVHRLSGQMALAYSRIRAIDSDFYRVNRQHNVLKSIFSAYKSQGLMKILDVTETVLPHVVVTMDQGDMWSYLGQLAPLLSGFTIETHRVPVDGTWWFDKIGDAEIIMADLQANRDILAWILGNME